MSVVTAGVGHFQIPSAPAAGASVVSGAANNYTGTAIVLSASTSAIYITGVHVETSAALAATYITVGLMIGAGGSETFIGQYLVPLSPPSAAANATAVRTELGVELGRLDAAVTTRASAAGLATVDASVGAVKAKTDSLTFSVAGKVDANMNAINGSAITGTGTALTPWGPA